MPLNNSLSSSRVINPINTYYAQNYTNAMFGMHYLFPHVAHVASGGTTIIMDTVDFDLENQDVSPDETGIPELKVGYDGRAFAKSPTSYNLPISYRRLEDAAAIGIPIEQFAMESLMKRIALKFEYRKAILATTAANYATTHRRTLTGGDQLNNPTSDIEEVRDTAHAAGIRSLGMRWNILLGSFDALDACVRHPTVKAQYNPTTGGNVTLDQLAAFFKVQKVVEINASYRPTPSTSAFIFGKNLVFAYVDPAVLNQPADAPLFTPTPGITMLTSNYGMCYVTPGHPAGMNPVDDPLNRRMVWGADLDAAPVLTAVNKDDGLIIGGYLVKDAVA